MKDKPEKIKWLWITDRAGEPAYTPADVRLLTGASAADLQNWANRGIIKPRANKPGKGGVRLYKKTDLVFVKTAKWLSQLGIETKGCCCSQNTATISARMTTAFW